MFEPNDIGRITPEEQADALRTLVATFSTSVVRPGAKAPRNAVTAEIIDILDEVPADRAEAVAQLFAMMALRLRRKGTPRRTTFRLALETALLARNYAGDATPPSEVAYLSAGRPGLGVIDVACGDLEARVADVPPDDRRTWLTAQAVAAGMIDADGRHRLGGSDRNAGDLAVAEFLIRAAAQYLAGSTPVVKDGPDHKA